MVSREWTLLRYVETRQGFSRHVGRPRTRLRGKTLFAQWLWPLIDDGVITVERAASACGATVKSMEEWLTGAQPRFEPALRAAIEKEAGLLQPAKKSERDPLIDDVLGHVERELRDLLGDAKVDRRGKVFEHFKNQVSFFADYARELADNRPVPVQVARPPTRGSAGKAAPGR